MLVGLSNPLLSASASHLPYTTKACKGPEIPTEGLTARNTAEEEETDTIW